jgi:hypothetical protein
LTQRLNGATCFALAGREDTARAAQTKYLTSRRRFGVTPCRDRAFAWTNRCANWKNLLKVLSLRSSGGGPLRIEPLRSTAHAKAYLIQRLIVAIEQRKVTWPAAWFTLTDELKRFE